MSTNTFPLKYRRKSSPPPSPQMLSPMAPFSSSFLSPPPPKWLDSDDDLDHEPALTSDDALTVFSSGCSRAPSLAPLDAEEAHVDIVSSPVREVFFRVPPSSRAPLQRHSKSHPSDVKASTTREDVAAALLALHAQPRLGPSQPVLAPLPTQTEPTQPPPARRPRVVTPSLRNLVLPRTPSPPPRTSIPLTLAIPVIDHDSVHATAPSARRTPSRPVTPASSPLPPSSPLAEEADFESSESTTFHSVPCPRPKPEHLQPHTPSDDSEADNHAPPWSRDDKPKEGCDHLVLIENEASLEASLITAAAPSERHLALERRSCAPLPHPHVSVSSPVLSPKSDQRQAASPTSDDPNGARQPHGSRPTSPFAAAPSHLVQAPLVPPSDGSLTDLMDHDTSPASPVPLPFSRAASSALSALDSTPPTPRDRSSPLSSPPSSPSPEQRQKTEPLLPLAPDAGTGIKRHAPTPNEESDPDARSASASPPPDRARARAKRRRRNSDSDDKPWRDRKKLPLPPAADEPVSALPPVPASPPRASSSSSTTAISATASFLSPSPTANPDPPDAEDDQPCPHPTLLGTLIEALALSRASSLPLSTLTRTTPALADYPHAVLTSTLAWAVRSRVLGCVHSSGEALPPSYFYDPATDPDRERGDLLRCLMPRAGKRRETMKYKQYYWAPVVVGRGRTRTWDVDWDE